MPDAIQKIISGNGFNQGTAVVSITTLPVITNHTLAPKINQTAQILTQSGVLDSRLDDVRYYSGDTSA
jgi:hypothetical protein